MRRLATALVLVALIAGFYWKLVIGPRATWLAGDDVQFQVLPWLQFQAVEWHAGRIPLWDPYHWLGQPLLGQGQPGVASPVNWLLFAAPLDNGRLSIAALHGYFILIHILTAWFAYKLAREFGCGRVASVAGGLVYSLAGWMGRTMWPQILLGAVWTPLALLYTWRATHGRRPFVSSILGGFFLGVAWLSGHPQVPLFASLALVGVWLWSFAHNHRLWRACLLFWSLAALGGALQLLPMFEYGRLAVRWAGAPDVLRWRDAVPYDVHRAYSLHPASLLGMVLPDKTTHPDAYLGATVCALAGLGLMTWRRNAAVRLSAALALGGLLMAMAPNGLLHGVLYGLIPGVEKARSPNMALFLVVLGTAMLAAIGLDSLPAARRWLPLGAALFGAALLVDLGLRSHFHDARMIGVAACAMALPVIWNRPPLLVAFIAIDLLNVQGTYLTAVKPYERLDAHSDIAAFLRSQPQPLRVDIDLDAIPYNFGDWHRIDEALGYHPSVTENVYSQALFTPRVRKLFGMGYAVRRVPDDFYREVVFSSHSGLNVYRNADVRPRVFAGPDDRVRLTGYLPNHVSIAAVMAHAGVVVLSDTDYPGWQAWIDGRSVEIQQAYGAVRSVAVPAGSHHIEFRYRPASVACGAAFTALAALLALGAAIQARRTTT